MKRYIKSNYGKDGYMYITKHGIGPGTLPKDVKLLDAQDLDNYMTAIWLDRFLTTKELEYYDIYPETSWQHKEYSKGIMPIDSATVKNGNTFKLQNEIWDAIVRCLTGPAGGFPEDEIKDYVFVDVKSDDDYPNYYVVEVRAELSYRGMEKLLEYIDPVVQKYDKNAYFDFVDSGIVEAYVIK